MRFTQAGSDLVWLWLRDRPTKTQQSDPVNLKLSVLVCLKHHMIYILLYIGKKKNKLLSSEFVHQTGGFQL